VLNKHVVRASTPSACKVISLSGLATLTDDELVKATVRGIRRTLGTAKIKKAPPTAERLRAMAANTGGDLKGLRDRVLLLIGFAGALRRSELVALNIEDIEQAPDGMKITIRHSKTDQEGAGQTIAIPFGKIACPVAALKEWITAAGIGSGALALVSDRSFVVASFTRISTICVEYSERTSRGRSIMNFEYKFAMTLVGAAISASMCSADTLPTHRIPAALAIEAASRPGGNITVMRRDDLS
jgi:hypothetical protein